MRRVFTLFLLAGVVTAMAPAFHVQADQGWRDNPRVARCASRFDWRRVGQRPELVRCVARSFDVPGGPSHFLDVGYCESGADLQDVIRDRYVGTYQHITTAWGERWRKHGRPVGVPRGSTNVLSQAVVTARMVRSGGWSPWSCA